MDITGRTIVALMVRPVEADLLRLGTLVATTAKFGGAVTKARLTAILTGQIPRQLHDALTASGLEVRAAAPDAANPIVHAAPLFHLDEDWDTLVGLDVASAVAGDFSSLLDGGVVAARPAARNPIALADWHRLFEHMGLRMPAAYGVTSGDCAPSVPYYDTRFMVVPARWARPLRDAWKAYAARLQREADKLWYIQGLDDVLAPVALVLALRAAGIPARALSLETVFPTAEAVHPALYPAQIAPAVLFYGGRLNARGLLEATPHTGPNRAVAKVNALLSSLDGAAAAGHATGPAAAPRAEATAASPGIDAAAAPHGGSLTAAKRTSLESFLGFTEGGEYPRYPLEVFLEVSNVCDLKCAMCRDFSLLNPNRFKSLRNQERGFIEKDDFVDAMDEVLKHALVVHCFGFGEPTIHPNFRELIDYLSNFEVAIDFFTNGMHLTEDLCDFLVERRVAAITVSFSGANKEDYENVYQGGDFERVLGGIERLAKAKQRRNAQVPNIIVNSLSFQHHIDTLPEFVAMMAARGVNHIFVKQLGGQADNPIVAGHIAVNRPWVEGKKLEQAKALAKQLGIGLSAEQFEHSVVASEEEAQQRRAAMVMGRRTDDATQPVEVVPISRFKEVAKTVKFHKPGDRGEERPTVFEVAPGGRAALLGMTRPTQPVKHPCMEPFKTLYVRKNGRVKTCCFHDSLGPALGDVGQQQGIDIWRGPGYRLLRDGVVAGEYPAGCQTCLKIGYGPWSHFLRFVVGEYDHWYKEAIRQEFLSPVLRKRVVDVAENAQIIARRAVPAEEMPVAAES